jgi:hypothetical protein
VAELATKQAPAKSLSIYFYPTEEGNIMSINMNYRPPTYWPESENREQCLTKILGKARRDITRKILNRGGIKELNAVGAELSQGEFGGNDRQAWGSLHPNFMGGEYLPTYDDDEVEIIRISLKSTTADKICVRACRQNGTIKYRVVDEYDTDYVLPIDHSEHPLALSELINLLENTDNSFDEVEGGLIRNHWLSNVDYMEPEEAVDFVSVESVYYSEVSQYYSNEADKWLAEEYEN